MAEAAARTGARMLVIAIAGRNGWVIRELTDVASPVTFPKAAFGFLPVVPSRSVTIAHDGAIDQIGIDVQPYPADLYPVRTRVLLGPLAQRPAGTSQVFPVIPQRDPEA